MFRRKNKKKNGEESSQPSDGAQAGPAEDEAGVAAAPPGEAAATEPPEPVVPEAEHSSAAPVAAGALPEDGQSEATPRPAAVEARPADGEVAAGYDDDHLPVSFWVESVFDNRPPPSLEERERQAAAEFEAAIAPGLEKLRDAVPDASSPDEARRLLEERQGEVLVDEEGERLKQSDMYSGEASVHYRIQRHFRRPRGRVGWGEWRPPPGLAGNEGGSPRPGARRGSG
jgi:hypothetical protein